MSESSTSSTGLFAYPISDPALQFHRVLYDYAHKLGRVGRDVIIWRPIGDPSQHDDEYSRVRTGALKRQDEKDSERFREEVRQLDSKDWICQREYEEYARTLGVQGIAPPLVVFTAPTLKNKAILKFEPIVLDKPEWTRTLAEILGDTLTAAAFSRLRKGSVFTDETIEAVQRYLWTVGEKIYRIHTNPRRKLPESLKIGFSRSRLEEHVEPSRDTKMNWWLREDGSLTIDTVSQGKVDGKAEFPLLKGVATKQQNLLLLLIKSHPDPLMLGVVLREVYPDMPLTNDAKKMRTAVNCVRALVNAVRKKLVVSGIPAGVLPSVALDADRYYETGLNVATVVDANENP